MRCSYKQFVKLAFENGADYVQPQHDGQQGVNRVLISAIAVKQNIPKVVAVWVRNKGIVWAERSFLP